MSNYKATVKTFNKLGNLVTEYKTLLHKDYVSLVKSTNDCVSIEGYDVTWAINCEVDGHLGWKETTVHGVLKDSCEWCGCIGSLKDDTCDNPNCSSHQYHDRLFT